jgi:HEXXH motif-containing protein
VSGLSRRLGHALALVEEAWPQAGEEIRRRTWLIVPLVEPGTVSYSLQARPGISYISVYRGSLPDLADDLVHETAHHRLHARQEAEELIRDPEETRRYSPWRRSQRPIHGILHGTFTFLFRAELFLRLAAGGGRERPGRGSLTAGQRSLLAAEARRELSRCRAALSDLSWAGSTGLLTPAGKRLVDRMRRRQGILRRGVLSDRALSSIL